jgi:hypothetical protein
MIPVDALKATVFVNFWIHFKEFFSDKTKDVKKRHKSNEFVKLISSGKN